MKKKYTKPGIVKVELKPEQAVIGQCSTGFTDLRDSDTTRCSSAAGGCRQYRTGDDAYTS